MRIARWILLLALTAALAILLLPSAVSAPAHKTHSVALSAAKKVPYSKLGDPAGAATGEDSLRIRALVVDGLIKEWTTGDAHDVTDRSFVVRRVTQWLALSLGPGLSEGNASLSRMTRSEERRGRESV